MASRYQPPPLIEKARHLFADIEQVVSRFDRRHRYQLGTHLRSKAWDVLCAVLRAWRDKAQRLAWALRLQEFVDELKELLQACLTVRALTFRHFERLAVLAKDLGAQVGGWLRKLQEHPSAQNAQAQSGAQRGVKLSTCAASAGANP